MDKLTVLLPGLACAGGMVLAMWLVMGGPWSRSRRDRQGETGAGERSGAAAAEEIARLRHEVAQLRAEQAQNQQPTSR